MNLKETQALPHFCIYPWKRLNLYQDGRVTPCCFVPEDFQFGNLKDSTLKESWNSREALKMRKTILAGDCPDGCKSCHEKELISGASPRTDAFNWFNEKEEIFEVNPEGISHLEQISFLDLRFSNICNFKCRSCSGQYSTSWDMSPKTLYRLFEHSQENIPSLLAELLPQIQSLYFAGGEPLLDQNHYDFLNLLIQRGKTDVGLTYNTNGSTLVFKQQSCLDLWKNFKHVRISLSLDGIGANAELLRKGSNWKSIEQNILRLKSELPNAQLIFNPTVSLMNVFHLPLAIQQWVKSGILDESVDFKLNFVTNPRYLSLNTLNEQERQIVRARYAELILLLEKFVSETKFKIFRSEIGVLLKSLDGPFNDEDRKLFRRATFAFDKKRKERFVQLFPEHFSMLYEEQSEASPGAPVLTTTT